jgi:hypothetical protein
VFEEVTLQSALEDAGGVFATDAAGKADLIARLWYAKGSEVMNDNTTLKSDIDATAAAMQLAIWEILHDYDSIGESVTYEAFDDATSGGNFYTTGYAINDSSHWDAAAEMLNAAVAYGDLTGPGIKGFINAKPGDAQNQAMLVGFELPNLPPAAVPLPAAAWPCVGLLAGVVGWKKYRGRKIEAA